jgi:hypothetical protein
MPYIQVKRGRSLSLAALVDVIEYLFKYFKQTTKTK